MKAMGRTRVSHVLRSTPKSSDVRKAILSRQGASTVRPWERYGELDEVAARVGTRSYRRKWGTVACGFFEGPCQGVTSSDIVVG